MSQSLTSVPSINTILIKNTDDSVFELFFSSEIFKIDKKLALYSQSYI